MLLAICDIARPVHDCTNMTAGQFGVVSVARSSSSVGLMSKRLVKWLSQSSLYVSYEIYADMLVVCTVR